MAAGAGKAAAGEVGHNRPVIAGPGNQGFNMFRQLLKIYDK
jgi:hypothetical protein